MALPAGTVTFLFSDIEGSTTLARDLGDGYASVLEEHARILRAAFESHEGHEIDTQGDSFFVAFPRAKSAVLAAAAAQRALAEHSSEPVYAFGEVAYAAVSSLHSNVSRPRAAAWQGRAPFLPSRPHRTGTRAQTEAQNATVTRVTRPAGVDPSARGRHDRRRWLPPTSRRDG